MKKERELSKRIMSKVTVKMGGGGGHWEKPLQWSENLNSDLKIEDLSRLKVEELFKYYLLSLSFSVFLHKIAIIMAIFQRVIIRMKKKMALNILEICATSLTSVWFDNQKKKFLKKYPWYFQLQ